MKYFIASRWRNKKEVIRLYEALKKKVGEDNVFCFFNNRYNIHHSQGDPEKEMEEFENLKNWQNNDFVKQIFSEDIQQLKEADALIMLLPAGNSAHIEAGIAYGLGKKCILVGKVEATESHYLIFHEYYDSIEELMGSI